MKLFLFLLLPLSLFAQNAVQKTKKLYLNEIHEINGKNYIKVQVIDVKPVFEKVEIKKCKTVTKTEGAGISGVKGKEIAGAAAGGLIGSLLMKKKNKDKKAMGVAIGTYLGSELADDDSEIRAESIVGASAGAVLGAQFGKGKGNQLAAGTGAFLGKKILDPGKKRRIKQCEKRYKNKKKAYLVSYELNGQVVEELFKIKPSKDIYIEVK